MLRAGCNEIVSNIVNCRMFCGEKNKKKNVKIKTQNEKIVETYMDIWYYTYKKTVIRVRKKQCNVSSWKNNL